MQVYQHLLTNHNPLAHNKLIYTVRVVTTVLLFHMQLHMFVIIAYIHGYTNFT